MCWLQVCQRQTGAFESCSFQTVVFTSFFVGKLINICQEEKKMSRMERMREMRIETCCDSDDSMANSLRCWHSRTALLILHEFLFWPNIHWPTKSSTNRYALQSHRKLQLTDSDMSANLDIPLGVPHHKLWFTINRFKQSHLDFFFVSSLKSTKYNGCKIKLEPIL